MSSSWRASELASLKMITRRRPRPVREDRHRRQNGGVLAYVPDGRADPVPVQRRQGVNRDAEVLGENTGVEGGVLMQSHLRPHPRGYRLTLALEPSSHRHPVHVTVGTGRARARMIISNACTPFSSRLGSLRRYVGRFVRKPPAGCDFRRHTNWSAANPPQPTSRANESTSGRRPWPRRVRVDGLTLASAATSFQLSPRVRRSPSRVS